MWVGALAIGVGEYTVGLRSDEEGVLATLRTMYDDRRITTTDVPHDFGISVNRRGGAGPRMLPALLHGRAQVLHSRSAGRVIRCLDSMLGSLERPLAGSTVRTPHFAAVVHAGAAALVPTRIAARSSALEEAAIAAGAAIADSAALAIDLESLEAVVSSGLVGPTVAAERPFPFGADPGRYEIRSVFWSAAQVTGGEGRAESVARFVNLLALPSQIDRDLVLQQVHQLSSRFAADPLADSSTEVLPVVRALS